MSVKVTQVLGGKQIGALAFVYCILAGFRQPRWYSPRVPLEMVQGLV